MGEFTEEEALKKMMQYCSASEHCRSEAAEKMQRWGIPYATIDRIIARLEAEDFLNEERYCRAFIHDKYSIDKWGKQKIAQALYVKKIPSRVYQTMWGVINREEYENNLRRLLETKKKSIHADSEYERNAKLIRFAVSRGYDLEDIRRFIPVEEENIASA